MRKFITKISLFFIPIVIVAIVAEVLLRNVPNDYKFKHDYLSAHAPDIKILILGSSHSFFGIDPQYFDIPSFNASHVSQSMNFDAKIFETFEDKLVNLTHVIIPVSYSSLYGDVATGVEKWRVKNYVLYYGMTDSFNSFVDFSELLSNNISLNKDVILGYYVKGLSNITCSEYGWGTIYKSNIAQDLEETGKQAAVRHTRDMDSPEIQQLFIRNQQYLESIIKKCNERSIKVILVTTPAYTSYVKNLDNTQLKSTTDYLNKVDSVYPNCIYYNFLEHPAFVSEDYYDADHLSEIGAKKLSLILNTISKSTDNEKQ
jgi:hypothetical protein